MLRAGFYITVKWGSSERPIQNLVILAIRKFLMKSFDTENYTSDFQGNKKWKDHIKDNLMTDVGCS